MFTIIENIYLHKTNRIRFGLMELIVARAADRPFF